MHVWLKLRRGAVAAAMLPGLALAGPGLPPGPWLTADGEAAIRIGPCQVDARHLCGAIVWLRRPNDPITGKPVEDKNNPDPARQRDPLLGLAVLRDLAPSEDGSWRGTAYDADDGRTYHVTVASDGGRLTVRGCVLLLCAGETWMPVLPQP